MLEGEEEAWEGRKDGRTNRWEGGRKEGVTHTDALHTESVNRGVAT